MTENNRPTPVGALDATKIPRFAGLETFARIPDIGAVPDYDIAVLGVPFFETATGDKAEDPAKRVPSMETT